MLRDERRPSRPGSTLLFEEVGKERGALGGTHPAHYFRRRVEAGIG